MPANTEYKEHRFGISFLSKNRMKNAYPEEVLINKTTGEMLLKTQDEDIISFDSATRKQCAINKLIHYANENSIYGDIFDINNPTVTRNTVESIETFPISIGDGDLLKIKSVDFSGLTNINRGILFIDAESYLLPNGGNKNFHNTTTGIPTFVVNDSINITDIAQIDLSKATNSFDIASFNLMSINYNNTITDNVSLYRTIIYSMLLLVENY